MSSNSDSPHYSVERTDLEPQSEVVFDASESGDMLKRIRGSKHPYGYRTERSVKMK